MSMQTYERRLKGLKTMLEMGLISEKLYNILVDELGNRPLIEVENAQ